MIDLMENSENEFVFSVKIALHSASDKRLYVSVKSKCQLIGWDDSLPSYCHNDLMKFLDRIERKYEEFIKAFERQGNMNIKFRVALDNSGAVDSNTTISNVYKAIFEWAQKLFFVKSKDGYEDD